MTGFVFMVAAMSVWALLFGITLRRGRRDLARPTEIDEPSRIGPLVDAEPVPPSTGTSSLDSGDPP